MPRPRSLDEVRGSILTKLSALARVREREQLASGWSRDEEGRMIPPGWVRADGGAGSGGPEDGRPGEGGAEDAH
ncbi:MAG: hypothetical protein ACK40O_08090 [Allosphingosinicella sp.]